MEKALVINDLHFPFQNQRAIDLALRIGQFLKPDYIFLNGDVMDCWEVSSFVKDKRVFDKANLIYEMKVTKTFLKELRWKFKDAKIIYIFGNHEYRWQKNLFIKASELVGLPYMTLPEQLETKDLKIEIIDNGTAQNSYLYGNILIGHFDKVNKFSGYTAKNLLDQYGVSLIQAHTHRGGSSLKRIYDKDIQAYENFCLCDRDPLYTNKPNWGLGFSIIYTEENFQQVEQIPISETYIRKRPIYKCVYNGQLYIN